MRACVLDASGGVRLRRGGLRGDGCGESFELRALVKSDRRLPLPPRYIGINGLGENRGKIYGAQYFTGKIFKTLGLCVTAKPGIFSDQLRKILDLKELLAESPASWLQNIDSTWITRKILQNRNLVELLARL